MFLTVPTLIVSLYSTDHYIINYFIRTYDHSGSQLWGVVSTNCYHRLTLSHHLVHVNVSRPLYFAMKYNLTLP